MFSKKVIVLYNDLNSNFNNIYYCIATITYKITHQSFDNTILLHSSK